MNTKLFGGILLILGTCIGAGLLALPISTAPEGFITSVVILVAVWMAMTIGAFLILEVNLWFPEKSNLISMSRATLGKRGAAITWLSYLLLLYALMCAYIATNSDILGGLLADIHITMPPWLSAILIVAVFGYIVFRGIYSVDIVNRGLMSSKIIIFAILILVIAPHISLPRLNTGQLKVHLTTIMVVITSFGYAIIIPSLRSYYKSDVKMLRRAILIGSLIPLVFYILWIAVIHGLIPIHGKNGLLSLLTSQHATSDLTRTISATINKTWITTLTNIFVSICAVTSFLGVSLALSDFLSDGLNLPKTGYKALLIFVATFIPPLIIIMLAPGAFIEALAYAGVFCIVVLMLLPAMMAWNGRYRLNLGNKAIYKARINKLALFGVIVFGAVLMGWSFWLNLSKSLL